MTVARVHSWHLGGHLVQQLTRLAVTFCLQDLGSALSLGQALADAVQRRAIDHVPNDCWSIAGNGPDDGMAVALDCLAHCAPRKKNRPTHSSEGRRISADGLVDGN